MAYFVKVGRPRIGLKNRDKQKKFFIDEDELKIWDDLFEIMAKRRNINSQVDLFMYLVNREYTRQDKIKIINK
ncbi:MAG TPA: hypothetical protein VN922_16635 [Bacteroidia bacterium]|nr:hypothetical protein [Bacteroidia bacterium]